MNRNAYTEEQRSEKTLITAFHGRCIFLAICVVVVSCWRWKFLWSSILSIVLAVPVLVTSMGESGTSIRWSALVEYWVAAIVWMIVVGMLVRILVGSHRRGENGNRDRFFYPARRPQLSSAMKADFWLVVTYVIIALEAPLFAPYDPSSQGDLRTMRLLKPMERAYVSSSAFASSERSASGEDRTDEMSAEFRNLFDEANINLFRGNERIEIAGQDVRDNSSQSGMVSVAFLFGTDNLGRDVFSRVLYGMRITLFVGSCAMVLSLIIGTVIGIVAGFSNKRWIDHVLMRMVDLLLAVPSLFLVIAIIAFFGNSTLLLILVLGATGWMSVARMVRGEVIALREREFILAARMLGRSTVHITMNHIIPNIFPTVVVAAVLQFGNVILAEASLSFLGLGIQPPTPSLGNMIGESLAYLERGWWVSMFPGIALTLVVLSVNRCAERLQYGIQGGHHGGGND
ncbi:MAG: ABC transporter permease [Ignavibacteria bacterium]|nr:ABC transporter permease [Ignavibacteria bacterium]